MNKKKPGGTPDFLLRKFDFEMFDQAGNRRLYGPVTVVDRRIGATIHTVFGDVRDPAGQAFSLTGTICGARFVCTPKKTGRPSKDLRNVAAYMSFLWFQVRHADLKSDPRKARARECVLEHWQSQGWAGMPEQSDANRLIRGGKKVATSVKPFPSACVRYVTHDGKDGAVVLLPRECCIQRADQLEGNGIGWVWRPASEEAEFGQINFICPLLP